MTTTLLTGPVAADLLGAALAADGAKLGAWTVDRVHARPGAEVSVGYAVQVRRGALTGPEYLVATTADLDPVTLTVPGTVRLDGPAGTVHVWRHPGDPALPGLAVASDAAALSAAWARVDEAAPTVLAVEFLTYRPLRRAVLRATTTAGTVHLKVVRPRRADALVDRHEVLRDAATPAPRVLAVPVPGLLILETLSAPSLVTVLAGTPVSAQGTAIDPADVVAALAALPPTDLSARAPWSADAAAHARNVESRWGLAATPLADAVAAGLAATPAGPVVTTHGDAHGANLLATPGTPARVAALLDVDTLGPGHLVDDLACFVAHLAALPALDPARYAGVPALVERTLAVFDGHTDPRALRVRSAGVLLSLVPGAPDLEVATSWLDLAHHLAGTSPATAPGGNS